MIFALALLTVGFTFSGCAKKAVKTDVGAGEGAGAYGDAGAGMPGAMSAEGRFGQSGRVYGDVSGATGIGKKDIVDVLFDYNSYAIPGDQKAFIENNAKILKEHADASITIEGHCDERGSNEYNIALGERRALAVKSYLSDLGIPAKRVKIISYGKEKPFCSEHNEACWQVNRRGHFVITK
jgi:peptidoglycan-associated lipoprotein